MKNFPPRIKFPNVWPTVLSYILQIKSQENIFYYGTSLERKKQTDRQTDKQKETESWTEGKIIPRQKTTFNKRVTSIKLMPKKTYGPNPFSKYNWIPSVLGDRRKNIKKIEG